MFSDALRSLPHCTLNPVRCTVLWNFHENVITLGVEDFGNTLSFYEIDWSGELRRNPLSLLDFSYYTHTLVTRRGYTGSLCLETNKEKKKEQQQLSSIKTILMFYMLCVHLRALGCKLQMSNELNIETGDGG